MRFWDSSGLSFGFLRLFELCLMQGCVHQVMVCSMFLFENWFGYERMLVFEMTQFLQVYVFFSVFVFENGLIFFGYPLSSLLNWLMYIFCPLYCLMPAILNCFIGFCVFSFLS